MNKTQAQKEFNKIAVFKFIKIDKISDEFNYLLDWTDQYVYMGLIGLTSMSIWA